MTTRVYLASATFRDGPMEPRDLPAERVFVNASGVEEIWVETESDAVPDVGRAVAFSLIIPTEIGFRRVTGTVERKLDKTRGRTGAQQR
ncbi:MAG: hypothetical protein ACR2GS_01315 [Thermomicrobiales bacterium]